MRPAFQLYLDARGDLYCEDGPVIDKPSGTVFPVGEPDARGAPRLAGELATSGRLADAIPNAETSTCLGGSGRNVIVSGLAEFAGLWKPTRTGIWTRGIYVLEVSGASAATISDETDVVAILSTGGTAPAGDFIATTYGQDTYNASAAFTLTVATERGWPGAVFNIEVAVGSGTAMGGRYSPISAVSWASDADADWVITVAADGSAEWSYDGLVIAIREEGSADDPCGMYISTEAGQTLNPTFPEIDEGEAAETNPFGELTVEFNWSGAPDLDIGVSFLGETVGFGYSSASPYLTWSGDNTTSGGPENVVIDLALAWTDGVISSYADVMALADWYPPAGGSGPATLTVTYDLPGAPGTPETITLHPGSATPAVTLAAALRIMADGSAEAVGSPWEATVMAVRRAPIEGVAYLTVTEAAGEVTSASGPFFAASLPAGSDGTVNYPLATSDGDGGLKQLHTGPLFWDALRPARSIEWGTVASSTAAGAQGAVRADASYLYGCVATDTWGRLEWDLTAWP